MKGTRRKLDRAGRWHSIAPLRRPRQLSRGRRIYIYILCYILYIIYYIYRLYMIYSISVFNATPYLVEVG